MAPVDFILNLGGLLLWLNWLSVHFDPVAANPPISLTGTLKKAGPSGPRRWRFAAGLGALLLIRAWIYREISPEMNWTPKLDLVFTSIPFRADYFGHMLLFSIVSFSLALAVFYLWLLLLSAANHRLPDSDPNQRLVRVLLKWIERWPNSIKLVLPLVSGALFWAALHPVFALLGIVPEAKSGGQLFGQAAIMGAASYLSWKYLIAGILLLHLINSYVYLGEHPFWNYISATARNLLAPVRWIPLRFGKMDLLPVAGIALIFLASEFLAHPPPRLKHWLYESLPF